MDELYNVQLSCTTSSSAPPEAAMSQIALFHSALGVRAGVTDLAARLRAAGHEVLVVDQYDGRSFDDLDEAASHVEAVGFPALMGRAVEAVAGLDDGFVAMGFSNGAGMAEFVATQRAVSRVVLMSGALPLAVLGAGAWPSGVAVQLHYAAADPHRIEEWVAAFSADVTASGAPLELHLDYPVAGHLFTDPTLPDEYDAAAAELLTERVLGFCAPPAVPH
jgi:dienelactone hydrolase